MSYEGDSVKLKSGSQRHRTIDHSVASGGTKVLRDRKLSPISTGSKEEEVSSVVDNKWYTSEEMLEKIKGDHSMGLDSLYNGRVKHEEIPMRIVAPFIEYALNPPKKPVDDDYGRYDTNTAQ